MSKFQKVVKHENSKIIEKMNTSGESGVLIIGAFEIVSDSNSNNMNNAMCTIKATNVCPTGFVSSNMCVGQSETDDNTNYCVLDTSDSS
jgi:hypothetical protein